MFYFSTETGNTCFPCVKDEFVWGVEDRRETNNDDDDDELVGVFR